MSTPRTWRVGSNAELVQALHNWQLGDIVEVAANVNIDPSVIYASAIRGNNVGYIIIDEVHYTTQALTVAPTDKPNRGPYASHQPWKARKHHG